MFAIVGQCLPSLVLVVKASGTDRSSTCGLYHQPTTVMNDECKCCLSRDVNDTTNSLINDSKVMLLIVASLTKVIYNCKMTVYTTDSALKI